MGEPKRRFGVSFYRIYYYWAFGIYYEQKVLSVGLLKWKLVIGMLIHYDEMPF